MILLILHDLYYGSVSAGCFNCRDSSAAGRSVARGRRLALAKKQVELEVGDLISTRMRWN